MFVACLTCIVDRPGMSGTTRFATRSSPQAIGRSIFNRTMTRSCCAQRGHANRRSLFEAWCSDCRWFATYAAPSARQKSAANPCIVCYGHYRRSAAVLAASEILTYPCRARVGRTAPHLLQTPTSASVSGLSAHDLQHSSLQTCTKQLGKPITL